MTQDASLTEDILQESLVRGLEHLEAAPIRKPSAWLYRVSTNLAIDAARAPPHIPLREDELVYDCSRPSGQNCQISEETGLTLDRLHPTESEILRRHYWDKESYFEIAEALGISPTNAKVTGHRARKRFEKLYTGALDKGYRFSLDS